MKRIGYILAATLAALMLAGCGGGDDAPSAPIPTQPQQPRNTPTPAPATIYTFAPSVNKVANTLTATLGGDWRGNALVIPDGDTARAKVEYHKDRDTWDVREAYWEDTLALEQLLLAIGFGEDAAPAIRNVAALRAQLVKTKNPNGLDCVGKHGLVYRISAQQSSSGESFYADTELIPRFLWAQEQSCAVLVREHSTR